jgi:phosphoglycolate phosphatase
VRAPLLILFDVDGTLFMTPDPLMGRAVVETLEEVYGVTLPADAIDRVDHAGQTTKRIGRLVLEAAGLDGEAVDAHLEAWCPRVGERYLELLADASTAGWEARPGTAEALAALRDQGARLALLTGNPEPVARTRMERLGLGEFFPTGQGGFGCDRELRNALIHLARERAGDWPASRTVEVGDTCRDVETAQTAGVRSVAFASGRVGRERLGRADAVVETMPELVGILSGWLHSP